MEVKLQVLRAIGEEQNLRKSKCIWTRNTIALIFVMIVNRSRYFLFSFRGFHMISKPFSQFHLQWCKHCHVKLNDSCLYRLVDRDLVQWVGGAESEEHCILEDSKDQKPFDQFKGTDSTFQWDAYTSKLDPSKSRYSVAEATRIAGEIEGEEPKNDTQATSVRGRRTAYDDSGVGTEDLCGF